jgi:hypothetical protein
MEMKTVKSSNIGKIGYENKKLRIEFKSGGLYEYNKVPEKTYRDFVKADSVGKYFHAKIRSKYQFKKIELTKPITKPEDKRIVKMYKFRIFYLLPNEKNPQAYEFEETTFEQAYEHAQGWIASEHPAGTKLLMIAQLTR